MSAQIRLSNTFYRARYRKQIISAYGHDIPNGVFAGPLANLGDVSAGEAVRVLDQKVGVDVRRDGALPQHGAEDLPPAALVRQRDVDQLV